ncbi:MAG: S41 family peptidase, partial [Bacteroidota bacterium]
IILTSDFTASAAEVLLLLTKDLPYVILVGGHTEGIFSDMYEFSLPNGWDVSLSHQQYFSLDNINYEGVGIPPDIEIINRKEDLENGHDSVLKKAIEELERRTN